LASALAQPPPSPSAPAQMAATGQAGRRMADRDEARVQDLPSLRMEPGMSPPVRIAGANPDLGSLGKSRWRRSLILIEGTVGVDGALHDVDMRPGDLDPRIA